MQDLASAIATVELLIGFKREFSKGQGKKIGDNDKGGGDRDKHPKKDKPTSGRVRTMRHRKIPHASYATDPTESLNALNEESLLPLSKKKRSKRRRSSSYSLPFKLRWNTKPADTSMWKPSSMVSLYKPC